MKPRTASVLVVEEPRSDRSLLKRILQADAGIEVAGAVADGAEVVVFLQRRRPDVVAMDGATLRADGPRTIRRIMATAPLPIVLISSNSRSEEMSRTFAVLEAGAVAVIDRPPGPGEAGHDTGAARLTRFVKQLADIKVVRCPGIDGTESRMPEPEQGDIPTATDRVAKLVAVGASTGGLPALVEILSRLPRAYPMPLLVVQQHIGEGFVHGIRDWLQSRTALEVRVPAHGEPMQPATVYLAPDHRHLGVGAEGTLYLSEDEPEHGMRPSVSHLFRAVRAAYGSAVVAVLLSGMGSDGAREMRALRENGALTLAQDRQSSIVAGMPGEAIRLDAASCVRDPGGIARLLFTVRNTTTGSDR